MKIKIFAGSSSDHKGMKQGSLVFRSLMTRVHQKEINAGFGRIYEQSPGCSEESMLVFVWKMKPYIPGGNNEILWGSNEIIFGKLFQKLMTII